MSMGKWNGGKRVWPVLMGICLLTAAVLNTGCGASQQGAQGGADGTGTAVEQEADQGTAQGADQGTAQGADQGTAQEADQGTAQEADTAGQGQDTAAPQGEVLHIYCFNDIFRNRMQVYYPGYKKLNSYMGMAGGTKIVWHQISAEDGDYRDVLREKLEAQTAESGQTESEDRIDLFVLDEQDLPLFTDSGYALDLTADLGIAEEELADQFPFTRELARDSGGAQRAATWQVIPGVFVYRRSIAEQVLGTEEPDEVQERISDWERFAEAAPMMTAQGYYMLSGYLDAYKACADASDTPWVTDNVIHISDSLDEWMTMANDFTNHALHNQTDLRSEEWYRDQTGEGKVFGFFIPAWNIHYTMQNTVTGEEDNDEDNAYGDYAVCMGPSSYHWESLYLVGAKGTDNPEMVADILRTMTCNKDVMQKMTAELMEFTNSVSGMEELAQPDKEDLFRQDLLGGQNPMPLYVEIAKNLHVRPATPYDTDLDTGFQVCAREFFTGKMTRPSAIEYFYKVAEQRHPELSGPEAE